MHSPVYNSPILKMPVPRLISSCLLCLELIVLVCVPASAQNGWHALEIDLAHKIAAATGPGAVFLDFANRSSLTQKESDEIRRGLFLELALLGIHAVPGEQAVATVRITLSENLREYVSIAQIQQGSNEPSVVMVSSPRTSAASSSQPSKAVSLQKTLLWTDRARILDIVSPSAQITIALEPERAVLLSLQNSHWQEVQSLAISHNRPWPRDMRGRLVLRKDHLFDAYLPGVFCQTTTSSPISLTCRDSDDPWPITADQFQQRAFFASTRNFFTGAMSPAQPKQNLAPPFFSAAPLPRDQYTLWILGAVDGQTHMLDGVTDQTARLNWGSDIASIHSNCGLGWQILATSRSTGAGDSITAFEVADREPVAVSQSIDLAGDITALWSSADAASVIAIAHNFHTGDYEAYRILVACNQ